MCATVVPKRRARQAGERGAGYRRSARTPSLTRWASSESAPAISQAASPTPNRREHTPRPARSATAAIAAASAIAEGHHQPLGDGAQVAALPGEQRPERHDDEKRHHQRHEGEIEERRADRDARAGQRFERQRVERADDHGRRGGGEEEVVEDERAFAADRARRRRRARARRRGRRRASARRR